MMLQFLKQRKGLILLVTVLVCLVSTITVNADLSTTKTLYTVGTAHLDTQWNWTIQTSINSYINKTMDDNFTLFGKYPNYNFTFEGAFRYALMKEYYPDKYATLKNYVSQNRWSVAGSSWDAGDVHVPSSEGIFRNILYGNGYFKQEFGKSSLDIFLPDCFGFGYALPSIASHAGLKGFSSQKLSWGSAYGVPFDIGRWIGPDGAYIGAALKPGSYTTSFSGDLSNNSTWLNTINANGAYGVYAAMGYHGTGDTGGAPADSSASSVNSSVTGTGPIKVISGSSDQLFRDITPSQLLGLPSYNGELVMSTHGTGCYTSRTINKRWNRKNELLADDAERASVTANWLGGVTYPQQRLNDAWKRFIWHTFHDDLTGTSVYTAYAFSHNDYALSLNQFAGELSNSVGAVARAMDTQATGTPVVVYNPLALARKDVVEARVYFPGGVPSALRVYDPSGAEVPSQMGTVEGNYATVIFLADMPSLGYETYDVQASATPCTISTGLNAAASTLNSNRYTVTVNSSGDISSIIDKLNGNKELLSGASRLQMQNDTSSSWPSWELIWSDVNSTPREYVSGTVSVTIVENGPARVALKVSRTQAGSTFNQIIRLNAGGDADRVEIDNNENWQTQNTLLKATFPFSVSNAKATYDLGLGTIQRGNDTSTLYEVPAQQWADITNSTGDYGVSIMNDCKYGWDKPNNNTLRLTLNHNPNTDYGSNGQKRQDLGKNLYLYAIYGHAGNWTTGGTVAQAARLNQPLLAFQAPGHTGALGKSYSFLSVNNSQVLVKAVKKAESSNEVIVRVQETSGASASNVLLTCGSGISSAREVNGQEDAVGGATVTGGQLQFSLTAYQPKTFALTLSNPPTSLTAPTSTPVTLTFDKDVVSPDTSRGDGNFNGSHAIPAELFPATITSEGVQFTMGPTANGQNNALTASGQSITLNASGASRLYLLAGSANGDIVSTFTMNGTPVDLTIRDMTANVGTWDLQSTSGSISTPNLKRESVAWVGTHLHTSSANVAYKFANLFKYRVDLPQGVSNPVLVLPSNSSILIFAMTLSNNSNDDTFPAGYLYDTADGGLTPPSLLDRCIGGTITASGENAPNEGKDKAFDDDVSSKWLTFTNTGWIQYDFAGTSAYAINQYTITSANDATSYSGRNPKNWTLQGSNDGSSWTAVDTRTNVSFTDNFQKLTFSCANTTAYQMYRLNITANNGGAEIQLSEIEMFDNGATPTPGPTATPTLTPTPTPTATPGPAALFSDGFESNNFTTGGWTNSGCTLGSTYKYAGTYAAIFNSSDSLTKAFSTVGYKDIQVKYARYTRSCETDDHFMVEWYNGSAWTVLEDLTGNSSWTVMTWTLPSGAFNNANFQLRCRTSHNASNDYAYLDEVQILGNPQ
jgi:alpha-mannosidase